MTPSLQRGMAWCGAAFILLLFPALLMAGLLPPMPPSRTAEEVAEFWSTNPGLKRCGLVLLLAAAGLQAPFGALIAARIKQMEGRYPPLAYLQLIGCALALVALMAPTFTFAAASYRPERDPQITQALNDLGWIPLTMNWVAATIQLVSVALAVFTARQPIWPRWFGYWSLWCGFAVVGGGAVILFRDGVFAWNGVVGFWVVAVAFGFWFLTMTWQLLVTTPDDAVDDPKTPAAEYA